MKQSDMNYQVKAKTAIDRSMDYFGLLPGTIKSYFRSLYRTNMSLCRRQMKGMFDFMNTQQLDQVSLITKPVFGQDHLEFLKYIGTTQGSPLSPYLSAICIQEIEENLPPGVHVIMYADDMIFYGPNLSKWLRSINLEEWLSDIGFTLHPEKSGWLKENSVVIKDHVKFLGMEYNFLTKEWKSQTRKGNTLIYNKEDLLSAEYDINEMIGKSKKETETEAYNRVRETWLKSLQTFLKIPWYNFGAKSRARDFLFHYMNQLTLFKSFGFSRIGYELFYLLLKVMSLPVTDLYRALLTGVLTLNKASGVEFVRRHFTPAGGFKGLNILDYNTKRWSPIFRTYGESDSITDSTSLTKGIDPYPGVAFIVQSQLIPLKGYVSRFRDKYTFSNFIKSSLRGMLMSRLYNGNWNLENIVQDFSYKPRIFSLGWYLQSSKVNVFTGTSYAVDELIRHMSGRNPKIKAYLQGYTIFSKSFWADPLYPERADESVLNKAHPDFGKGYDFESLLSSKGTNKSLVIYVPSQTQPPKPTPPPSFLETWLESWANKSLPRRPQVPNQRAQWIEEWTVKFNPRESVDRNRSCPERPSSRDK